jgi:hypothetical protein
VYQGLDTSMMGKAASQVHPQEDEVWRTKYGILFPLPTV